MKSMHLLLAAVLLTVAAVWARAATQGIEQALVSVGVESCLKIIRATTRALPNISALFGGVRISTQYDERARSEVRV